MEVLYKLNQNILGMYQKLVVPIVITRRIKIEDLDSGESKVLYDYKIDIEDGYTFSQVSQETVEENYKEALNIQFEKMGIQ